MACRISRFCRLECSAVAKSGHNRVFASLPEYASASLDELGYGVAANRRVVDCNCHFGSEQQTSGPFVWLQRCGAMSVLCECVPPCSAEKVHLFPRCGNYFADTKRNGRFSSGPKLFCVADAYRNTLMGEVRSRLWHAVCIVAIHPVPVGGSSRLNERLWNQFAGR